MLICEEKYLLSICCFGPQNNFIALLELLLAAHSKRLRSYLFEISVACEENSDRVVRNLLLRLSLLKLGRIENIASPFDRILFDNLLKLFDDDLSYLCLA